MTAKRYASRGVVLAAGDGSRLRRAAGTCPKVLLPVRGKPLIHYPIEAMAAAGINQVAVVVGYSAGEVITALGDGQPFGVKLDYILNQDYYDGNAVSISKVRAWAAGEPFVLCMGDHMIEPAMVRRLLNKFPAVETLCVDFTPTYCHDPAEATKVVVDGAGHIISIGKELVYWGALDTGVFLLTERFLDALDELLPRLGSDLEVSEVIQFMVNRGNSFATCDVSGCLWADIDTEDDLKYATV